jgi:predicted acyltransferase (DUF342 family)
MDLSATAVIITILGTTIAGIIAFIPGWIELRKLKDDTPLYIDEEYRISPFFLGDSFCHLLESILPKPLPGGKSRHILSLPSPDENSTYKISGPKNDVVVDVVLDNNIHADDRPHREEHTYCVYGDLNSGNGSSFLKETYVSGNVSLGKNSQLYSMFCGGSLTLDKNSSVDGWIDVRGDSFIAGEGCTLGYKTACKGNMQLSRNITFFNVFAMPLMTYPTCSLRPSSSIGNNYRLPELLLHEEVKIKTNAGDAGYIKKGKDITIKENVVVYSNIISNGNIVLSENCEIKGSVISHKELKIKANVNVLGDIKSRRNIYMEENVVIFGHVLADGKVILQKNCEVQGNIFSQRDIVIGSGCIVGRHGTIRSVVARDTITLHSAVTIYGSLSCLRGLVI